MTKAEALELTDPKEIWEAMIAEKDLLEDDDVLKRFNALRYEEFKQAVIRQFGSFNPECHYDFNKRQKD